MSGGFRSRSAGRRSQETARNQEPERKGQKNGRGDRRGQASRRGGASKRGPVTRTGDAAREAAFDVLLRVSEEGAYANLALPCLLYTSPSPRD